MLQRLYIVKYRYLKNYNTGIRTRNVEELTGKNVEKVTFTNTNDHFRTKSFEKHEALRSRPFSQLLNINQQIY